MFQVDTFSDRPFAGNPAAVLILDRPIDDALMAATAAGNKQSETAYALRDGDGDGWAIRWFTPTQEAAFCGHATLGAAHVLYTAYQEISPIRFSTRAVGDLLVGRRADGHYDLDLPRLDPMPLDPPAAFKAIFPNGWRHCRRNFENYFV
jgi:predicted PhzF superfamily epimerase YddE/YHI9